ncbi:MAG: tripartite tricarboxylate transporter substrate binding protein [Rhodovarius sp.]|nr:tripartite tricarboxylate transporter substrate binding protein [Rhodovarius sp.]
MRLPRRALPVITLSTPALAQSWPSRPTRLVIPFPPGGGLDALGRALAERLTAVWGHAVVVDNRPGGSTVPGVDAVAKAAPDGHTLLLTADNSITSNPLIIPGLPHDPLRDLAPVSFLLEVHQMVVAHPRLAAVDMAGLVAAARRERLTYGSYGRASQPHLLFSALGATEGVEFTEVPYRGLTPAVLATLAGEVQLTLCGVASAREHLAAGTLRALAIGRDQRLPLLPDVPTLAEAGYPDIDPRTWFGLFAPAATPAALVARLHRDVAAAMASPEITQRHLLPHGYTVHVAPPDASRDIIARDLEYKRALLIRAGLLRA